MRKKYFGIPVYEGSTSRRIRKLVTANQKSGKSALRFALYRDGMTVAEYIKECEGIGQDEIALFDITWDTDTRRRYIELIG